MEPANDSSQTISDSEDTLEVELLKLDRASEVFDDHLEAWRAPETNTERALVSLVFGYVVLAETPEVERNQRLPTDFSHSMQFLAVTLKRIVNNLPSERLDSGRLSSLVEASFKRFESRAGRC